MYLIWPSVTLLARRCRAGWVGSDFGNTGPSPIMYGFTPLIIRGLGPWRMRLPMLLYTVSH